MAGLLHPDPKPTTAASNTRTAMSLEEAPARIEGRSPHGMPPGQVIDADGSGAKCKSKLQPFAAGAGADQPAFPTPFVQLTGAVGLSWASGLFCTALR